MFKKMFSTGPFDVDFASLILRLSFCGLMIYNHAFIKLTLFGENPESFPDPLGIGSSMTFYAVMFAELICAALVLVGLFTRLALIPLMATMAVALFRVQWANPLTDKELPLLYLSVFVALFLIGPGKWSIDARLPIRKS